jgi:hypothetical protein
VFFKITNPLSSLRFVQPLNAPLPILVTLSGIFIVLRFLQPQKALSPIYVTPFGIFIATRLSQFKKALFYHEERSFFNNSKWAWRVIILLTGFSVLLTYLCFKADYHRFFTAVFDLFPIIKWQTVGETNEVLSNIEGASLLPGPDWLPASVFPQFISKEPNFKDPSLYASTIYYVCILMCGVTLFKSVLGCISRIHRGIKMSTQVFTKDLDKFDIGTVLDYSNAVNSKVPNEEKYVEKGE